VVIGISHYFDGCNTSVPTSVRSEVDAALGMTADHYVWYTGSGCQLGSVTQPGTATRPARDTVMIGAGACQDRLWGPLLNLGVMAASALRCGNETFLDDPQDCSEAPTADPYDAAGRGCSHIGPMGKQYLGWYGGCNSVRVNQSGTFTLHPREIECNGIQALQVPMPPSDRSVRNDTTTIPDLYPVDFYYLELRTALSFEVPRATAPTVLVRIGADYPAPNLGGRRTWLLDMNPTNAALDGMVVGQTFTDPAGGVSFTVRALSLTSATIEVTVPTSEPNTCAGGGTIASPGPATCAAGGTGGMGGAAGASGASGMAGMPGGTGGAGGNAATRGEGGAGASTGEGGASAGEGGASNGGSGGETGEAGAGVGGSGGTSTGGTSRGGSSSGGAGTSGAPSSAGEGGLDGDDGSGSGSGTDEDSGCGCRIDEGPARHDAALWIVLFGVFGSALRRRSRNRDFKTARLAAF
jgi:MYXO-CTERM domain-containing protein